MTTERERIVAAAVLEAEVVCALPRPARHHHIMNAISTATDIYPVFGEQGLVTSAGRFVNRFEAAEIAFAAGQISSSKEWLKSEDLW